VSTYLELPIPVQREGVDDWHTMADGYRDLLEAAIEELDNAAFVTTGRRSARARQLRALRNIVDRWTNG
jgi:hypothetical protein